MNNNQNNKNENSQGGYGYGGYYYGDGYSGYADSAVTPHRSLNDYVVILRERIWWLVVTVFVVFFGFALYTFNAPKVYQAYASVEVLREKDQVFQIEDVVHQEVANAEDFNTQIKVLESISIIQAVDERLKGEERRKFLAPYERGLDASLRGARSVPEILSSNRSIRPVRLSLVVNILYHHEDPEIAASVANYFAEEYIDFNREQQIKGSLRAVEDLRNQANQQLDKIQDLERDLANFKERFGTLSVETTQDQTNLERSNLMARLEEDKRIFDEISTKWNQILIAREDDLLLWELSFIAQQPQIPPLLSKLSDIKIQIASLSKKYRELHPTMIAAREQLDETKKELDRAAKIAAATIKNEYERAEKNYENSRMRMAEKEQESIEIDKIRPEYNALVRDLEVSKELYGHYYSRLQQANVKVTSEGATARIIDRAVEPIRPYKPNVVLNLVIGLILGSGLGLGLVFVLAFLDDKVKSAFDIESVLGIPLIGIVPRITSNDAQEKAIIAAKNFDKHTIESFRGIHSTLKLGDASKDAKVIVVTSTIPSEGKSFVSTNTAITYAHHGEKVVLIDGDLRMPNVAKSLGIENRLGIIQYINGEKNLDKLILKEHLPNLDVLVAGGRSKNPTQALSSGDFKELIEELKSRYDRVFIDTPPLAAVSDAFNILPLVDGVLYVIRFNMVKRKSASVNIKRLKESNTQVFGAVLNNLNTQVAGYYYSSYYDKSYDSYYLSSDADDDDEIPTEQMKS